MPRSKAQNEQLREDRRREILAAAVDRFAREGFAGTAVAAVAKAAGVSNGTVFLYFPTKEALFQAAVIEQLLEWEARSYDALAEAGTPRERIERYVRFQVRQAAGAESYVRLIHAVLGLRNRFPEITAEIFAFSQRQLQALAAVVAEGQARGELAPGSPFAVATVYYAWLNGAALVHLTPPDDPFWEGTIRYAMRIFGPIDQP